MRDRSLLNIRDQHIRNKYEKISKKNLNGVELYRHAAILEMLSKEFWLSTITIGRIVASTGEPDNQLEMFPEE